MSAAKRLVIAVLFVLTSLTFYAGILSSLIRIQGDAALYGYANTVLIIAALILAGAVTYGLHKFNDANINALIVLIAAFLWLWAVHVDLTLWSQAHLYPGANYSTGHESIAYRLLNALPALLFAIITGVVLAYAMSRKCYWLSVLTVLAIIANLFLASVIVVAIAWLVSLQMFRKQFDAVEVIPQAKPNPLQRYSFIVGAMTLGILAPLNFFGAGLLYAMMTKFYDMGLVVAAGLAFYCLGGAIVGGILGLIMAQGVSQNRLKRAWLINIVLLLIVIPNIFWIWDITNYKQGGLMTPLLLPTVILYPLIMQFCCCRKVRQLQA